MYKCFSLPGYYNHFLALKTLIEYRKTHEEYFIKDNIITSVYDFLPGLAWNGGRYYQITNTIPIEEIMEYFLSQTQISLKHVCTNLLLNEELVQDPICNDYIHRYTRPGIDSIIITNPILKEHLEKNFPDIQIIYSTTLDITDINIINNFTKDYTYVINYNYGKKNDYLSQLTHPENIEILTAEACIPECPYRHKHQISISKCLLGIPYSLEDISSCPFFCEIPFSYNVQQELNRLLLLPHNLSLEDVDRVHDYGINHFKLSDRARWPFQQLYINCYYLVKPEYLQLVYQELELLYHTARLKHEIMEKK